MQLTETSKPNLATSQKFLDTAISEIDAALENLGYTTPLVRADGGTGYPPKALAQVSKAVCHYTIAQILYARAAAVGGDASVASADREQKLYDKMLADWKDAKSPKELTDAQRTGFEVSKPDQPLNGLLKDDNGFLIEPRVTMDQRF